MFIIWERNGKLNGGYKEAKTDNKGEVIQFDTKEEAEIFAKKNCSCYEVNEL